jgi:hypothetical protein
MAVLVGCSGNGTDSGGASSGADGGAGAPEIAPDAPGESDADRQVVTTANASLADDDPADGAQQVSELVESVGGRIDERR